MTTAKITRMNAQAATYPLIPNNLPVPNALGSLESYIGAVHQIPVLTVEEEQDLARRLRDDNDLTAAQNLILAHLPVSYTHLDVYKRQRRRKALPTSAKTVRWAMRSTSSTAIRCRICTSSRPGPTRWRSPRPCARCPRPRSCSTTRSRCV